MEWKKMIAGMKNFTGKFQSLSKVQPAEQSVQSDQSGKPLLSLHNIVKKYPTGGETSVTALNGVSVEFRANEFVSILGPSGCGKTTLLNIIGGLDQYTDGDLIINGVSTKKFKDADWDSYRNHTIGFVFQSYNLIPHQTVLANVELALTLSGVSPKERRKKAIEALEQVGLGNQIHKKPNQMSGGQMQRVAIARALVNDPDILLADEPTGALDTQTSVQIMEILKSISKKKLIIMVTHNPELAEQYSSRIIRVLDGNVVDDTDAYHPVLPVAAEENTAEKKRHGKKETVFGVKRSMSFWTALSLSMNNLMTKKGRTFMTSFAGSIGIIGIALILSVSSGVNAYINSVQRDTLASYPIQLNSQTADLTTLVSNLMEARENSEKVDHDLDKVYESVVLAQMMNAMGSIETKTNDLASFKKHLEGNSEFAKYLSAVQYGYNFNWSVFVREGNELGSADGKVVKSDVMGWLSNLSSDSSPSSAYGSSMMGGGFQVWQELLAPLDEKNGSLVNSVITGQYELIDEGGRWPEKADEVVLIVNENNEISDLALFALGLRTEAEMQKGLMAGFGGGEKLDLSQRKSWSYEEIKQMEFRLLLASECYEKNLDGTYTDLSTTNSGREKLYNDEKTGFTLKVVGIIRAKADATSNFLTGAIGYTSALAKEALKRTQSNELLALQKADTENDVVEGKSFKPAIEKTTEEKRTELSAFLNTLPEMQQREFLYREIQTPVTDGQIQTQYDTLNAMPDAMLTTMIESALDRAGMTGTMTATDVLGNPAMREMFLKQIAAFMAQSQQNQTDFGSTSVEDLIAGLTSVQVENLYENENFPHDYSDTTYARKLALLGDVDESNPNTVYLYATTFENKDEISRLIKEYNDGVAEEQKIEYTDYVALLMSSITTIVNAISYVLIAFVAISLVVSSIMIGIITYISVLERTKEIGILRAIGASKRDVGRVFNAETLIVGFVAGAIGIVVSILLDQVINVILYHYTEIAALKAVLPVSGAVALVLISMFLTFIAGLFPSGFAAKRNPVEALRSE